MAFDAHELLRQRVVPFFQKDFDSLEKGFGICEILNIPVHGYKAQDSYGVQTIQSGVIRMFTVGSYESIGINMGTWDQPKIPMRFMDYKGATMVVPTNDDPPEFWCGGNYFPKLSPTTPFLTRDLTGAKSLIHLLEDNREMLVISISLRKELWLKNLLVGDSNNLIYCSETGANIVPRQGWKQFKEAYLELDKKSRIEALVIFRGTTKGSLNHTSDRVQNFYKDHKEFSTVCINTLPSSPLARTFWFSAVGAAI